MKKLFLSFSEVIIFLFFSMPVSAQEKPKIKFGKISVGDFAKKVYSLDSNANAIVIADLGKSEFIGDPKSGLTLQFTHFKRTHILNRNGYDIANVSMLFFVDKNVEENLVDLNAHTYNLENGKIVETKLDVKNNVFKDQLNKYFFIKKFTFPNIKEGSIIEYEYTIKSDFFRNLRSWDFQGEYPCLWSEYEVTIPEFYSYVIIKQGYHPFLLEEQKERRESYNIGSPGMTLSTGPLEVNVTDHYWAIKNIPALKLENFTSTLANHVTKIEFQMASTNYPLEARDIMGTWRQLSETLLRSEYFGLPLSRDNSWLADIEKPLISMARNDLEKAKLIYSYVRDQLTCTSHFGIDLAEPLKNILKKRHGTVSDINLLLTAMLKYADLRAEPVILSTREHGYAFAMYPVINKFNYVVTQLTIEGKNYYLDASQPHLGFGKLPLACYNGHARVINESATPVEFNSDSLNERKITSVDILNDEKGNWMGRVEQLPGYYESLRLRNRVKDKGVNDILDDIKKGYGMKIEIQKIKLDSLENYEEPLGIHYDFTLSPEKEEIIYLNPMLGERQKENPFKSAERFYPVEMPFSNDELYLFSMVIPEGYVVDELPKSVRIKLNEEEDGNFEYLVSESGGYDLATFQDHVKKILLSS